MELLLDLCFVVAVAVLAAELDHGIVEGNPHESAAIYTLLFIPIWWAGMSYTWFTTAFSHDDPLTRLLSLLQMLGVLAVAAALPAAGFMAMFVRFEARIPARSDARCTSGRAVDFDGATRQRHTSRWPFG